MAALALALTACGGSSSTSAPDVTGATRVAEWDETVKFSVVWDEMGSREDETHRIEIPVEKCELVIFHLVSSNQVEVKYLDAGEEDFTYSGTWGLVDDLHTNVSAEEIGIWTLIVTSKWGNTTPANVTVSYRVAPPRSGTTCS